jgi:hypothetical protein
MLEVYRISFQKEETRKHLLIENIKVNKKSVYIPRTEIIL